MTEAEKKICFLLNEVSNEGFDYIEVISQYVAAIHASGSVDFGDVLSDLAQIQLRTTDLLSNEASIWKDLMPGGAGPDVKWEVVEVKRAKREVIVIKMNSNDGYVLFYDKRAEQFFFGKLANYTNTDEIEPGMVVEMFDEELRPVRHIEEWLVA